MISSAGYECCFIDFEAGCATLLASTIRLLPMLILCSFFTVLATHRRMLVSITFALNESDVKTN
ncbi:hypothetical protein T05_12195 [Trichinella murrelli]|uniref:Uncharacterized protein n=1 Tax=Trichinella murrelli TaxID=144512 RepID=A0A0V0SXC2_9BILA|nr:hypothetical protein T05_12195 [Trichinella murrelli]